MEIVLEKEGLTQAVKGCVKISSKSQTKIYYIERKEGENKGGYSKIVIC